MYLIHTSELSSKPSEWSKPWPWLPSSNHLLPKLTQCDTILLLALTYYSIHLHCNAYNAFSHLLLRPNAEYATTKKWPDGVSYSSAKIFVLKYCILLLWWTDVLATCIINLTTWCYNWCTLRRILGHTNDDIIQHSSLSSRHWKDQPKSPSLWFNTYCYLSKNNWRREDSLLQFKVGFVIYQKFSLKGKFCCKIRTLNINAQENPMLNKMQRMY